MVTVASFALYTFMRSDIEYSLCREKDTEDLRVWVAVDLLKRCAL